MISGRTGEIGQLILVSSPRAVVRYARRVVILHFLPVWMVFLVVVAVCGLLLPLYDGPRPRPSTDTLNRKPKPARQFTSADALATILFLLFAAIYIALIFYKADFAYYDDNDVFTEYSARGVPYPPPIWFGEWRFFPLAFQEFNVLSHVTRSVIGYYFLGVAQLIVLLIALFVILEEVPIRFRLLVMAALMVTPSFVIVFTGLIFPERNIVFWLAIMLVCLVGYSKRQRRIYLLGCLITTQFLLYYKETVVVFVIVFAVSRMLLMHMEQERSQHSWRETIRNNSLPLGMIGVSCIYVVLFLMALGLPHGVPVYIARQHARFDGLGAPPTSLLLWQLLIDWLPLILLVVLMVRIAQFVFFRRRLDPLLDPLAAGAIAYYLSIIALRIGNAYYMAPVDFVAVFCLTRLSVVWLRHASIARLCIVAVVFLSIVAHDALYSTFQVVERKSVITAKGQFANFLGGYLQRTKGNTLELFFPYAFGYDLMELSSYLRYRGFHLEGPFAAPQTIGGGLGETRLVIEGREDFDEGKCIAGRNYVCHHTEEARPGALVVVLPDDNASLADLKHIGEDASLLLVWKAPNFCTRRDSWFRLLHAISRTYPRNQLPESWLQLYVFEQNAHHLSRSNP